MGLERMSYVARCPDCGMIEGAIVDTEDRRRAVAESVAGWIADGSTVTRESCADVRAGQWCDCAENNTHSPRAGRKEG